MTDPSRAAPLLAAAPRPEQGDMLDAAQGSSATLDLLRRRRSIKAQDMSAPGPSGEQIEQLLEIAARVPDHGKLSPWRFILFQGDARAAFGERLAEALIASNPDARAELVDYERARFTRAPLVIAVISSAVIPHKIPEWEQRLSAGAVCQNLLIAATAMGFAAQWLTEWYAFDEEVCEALSLGADERVAGFIYVGTPKAQSMERPRPDVAALTSRWEG